MMLWSKPGTLELGEGKGAARIKVGKRKGLSDDRTPCECMRTREATTRALLLLLLPPPVSHSQRTGTRSPCTPGCHGSRQDYTQGR